MFCLDFAAALLVHYQLAMLVHPSTQSSPFFTFPSGAFSGLMAAVMLYPFDLVRQMTVAPGTSHFAHSTVPYMTVYLGLYLLQPQSDRQKKSLPEKLVWAVGATSVAAAVEFPLDQAKHKMAGSMRSAAMANAFRVPFGSLMLIAYDRALTTGNEKRMAKLLEEK